MENETDQKGLVNESVDVVSVDKVGNNVVEVKTITTERTLDSHLVEIEELEREIFQASENIAYHTKLKADKEQALSDKQVLVASLK